MLPTKRLARPGGQHPPLACPLFLNTDLVQPQHLSVQFTACGAAREIVERYLGRLDQMPRDEWRSFGSPLFGTFDAAFPFQHGPPLVARFGQQCEHAAEIDLAVSQRSKAPRALRPRLIAAI